MQFTSLVLAAFVAAATSVQAVDTCAAGSILGIYAMCGSDPVDCGSGKCCLEGQKCVKDGSSVACADSALESGKTVTVNAACYGKATATSSKSGSASASATKIGSVSASKTTSGSSSESSSPIQGAGGSHTTPSPNNGGGSSYPYTNGTDGFTGAAPGTGAYTFTTTKSGSPSGAVSSGPALQTANAGISSYSSQSNIAALLSAVGIMASYWL